MPRLCAALFVGGITEKSEITRFPQTVRLQARSACKRESAAVEIQLDEDAFTCVAENGVRGNIFTLYAGI
ncbi:MAG: hypothetical protein ACI4KM_00560 [Oscillospiraceae bacterium]